MSWYLLAAISVISLSIGTLFQRLAMNKEESDPVVASILFQFLLGFITLLYALTQGFVAPPPNLLPFFLFPGALYAIGTIAFFKAYKFIGAAEATVLSGAGVIVTLLASIIFLRDKLTAVQFIGIFLILCAVVLVNFNKNQLKLNKGAWFALIGSGSYGLAVVGDTYIIRQYDAVSYLALICFVPGMLIYLRYLNKSKVLIKDIKSIDRNLFIFIVLYAIQAITFYVALQMGALVAQLSAIAKSSIILTVILATIFLNERKDIAKKIIGALLTTFGVLLVTSN